jgi:thymidylate synthase
MHVIESDYVDQALCKGLQTLDEYGEWQSSRAGEVLVAPWPVGTVNRKPMNRVSFSLLRDANPFFHLMEALWMLAGRNDATWLDQFVGDFSKRFAEEDGHMHGAYGFRWRSHFELEGGGDWPDQLEKAISLLTANPGDRQVVITMWDPVADLGTIAKDRPCNTHVYLRVRQDTQVVNRTTEQDKKDRSIRITVSSHVLDLTVCCRSNDAVWGCLSGDTLIQSPEGDLPIVNLATRFKLGLKRFPVYAVDPTTGVMEIKWCTRAWKTGVKPVRELVFDDGTRLRLTSNHRLYLRKTRRGQLNTPASIVETTAGQLKVGDRIWAPKLLEYGSYLEFKRNILFGTGYANRQKVHLSYDELLRGLREDGIDVHHDDTDTRNNKESNLQRLTKSEHMSLHMSARLALLTQKERQVLAKKGSLAAAAAIERMSPEELAELSRLRAKIGRENMTKFHARLSPEERSIRAKKASDAAKVTNTLEELQKRGAKGSASRWSDPEQHRRQSELMRKLNAEGKLRPNHKIVAINELPPEEVYDFTVDDYHTALVGSGVLVHNCHGANAVHFSVLQEYLAARIGVGIGTFYQFSNNYHVYRPLYDKLWPALLEDVGGCQIWYATGAPTPIVTVPDSFDRDLVLFFGTTWENANYHNRFFSSTAVPLRRSYAFWRAGEFGIARGIIQTLPVCDWTVAAQNWYARRIHKQAAR